MIYEFILIHLHKRNKLSRIHLKMAGFAKVCFGYKVVMGHFKRRHSGHGQTREPPRIFLDSS